MISNSVSNKHWIFKKYNEQDVIFYKENYSLDELTSKLLSIRNIRKEDVQTFLNPSIKNFLPDPEILNDMQKSAKRTTCLLYTSPSPRDLSSSRMPSSA